MGELGKKITVKETETKRFKFALCILDEDDNIVKMHGINTKWTAVSEGFLGEKFNVDIHDEIANIISNELKKDLTPEVIKELLKGLT